MIVVRRVGRYALLCSFWLLAGSHPGQAQDVLDIVSGVAYTDSVRMGEGGWLQVRPFIVAGSVEVFTGGRLAVNPITVDEARGRIRMDPAAGAPGELFVVRYRAFPLSIGPVFRLQREPIPVPEQVRRARPRPVASRGAAPGSGLRSRGAISRGVIAGTGRDVAIESGLRLEVDGSPAPGVEVQAVLTDETTPIRPDGTTQRLDEFDRVAVEIRSRNASVQLGDFDVALAGSRFARFARKLQGATASGALPQTGALSGGRIRVAGAAARGQFRVQRIEPVDGIQGPYRLLGNSGERFLIIVPGSEIVYVDGVRRERGASRDYTIDYATGEVTFMPRIIVTADRRIEIEFTYSLNQFTRTVLAAETDVALWADSGGRPRARIGLSWLREADGGQFVEEFGLTAQDSLRLAASGDLEALRSGAVIVAFDAEAPYVQYRLEHRSADGGKTDSVFVALESAPGESETVYRVQFAPVEQGAGSYERGGQSVNGIVYRYVGPGLGSYEPVRRLPRPSLKRLLDLRGSVMPVAGVALEAEWARSLNDLNRLSTLDAADDHGDAVFAQMRIEPSPELFSGRIGATVTYTGRSSHFSAFDRTRPVEFARSWNLAGRAVDPTGAIDGGADEAELRAELRWTPGDSSSVSVTAGRLDFGSLFEGRRATVRINSSEPGAPLARYALDLVETDDSGVGERGRWQYHVVGIEAPANAGIRPYLEFEREQRTQRSSSDSLTALSIAYLEIRPGVRLDRGRSTLRAELERRIESWPMGTDLARAAGAWTGSMSAQTPVGADWTTRAEIGWRSRSFEAAFAGRPGAEDSRALLLGWSGDGRPRQGRVRVSWFYQARSERTPTLQEIYFRAGPERGEYVWVDGNGDGVIQVDEFLPETTPDEGLYVRTYLPSDSLSSVTAVQARFRTTLEPGRATEGILAALSGQTVVEVEERSRDPERTAIYLLDPGSLLRPGSTLNGRFRIRQDVSLFRGRPSFGADVALDRVRSLSELATGLESRDLDRLELSVRGRPSGPLEIRFTGRIERNATDSDAFSSRRFDLRTRRVIPALVWRNAAGTSIRIETDVAWKKDRRAERSSRIVRLPISARVRGSASWDLGLRVEMANADVNGTAAGLAAWELTDGRGPGTSFLWGATMQWAMGSTLRATLAYDGRAPSSGPVIHTGRLELGAVF